jgi:stage II sporulation protein D
VEEKKAQAIAARSYAIAHLGRLRRYDILSTTLDQVYRPTENAGAAQAVEETHGLVLVDEETRELVEAFYHSTCGGHTENAREIWSTAPPYRWATTCDTCAASPRYRWEVRLTGADIADALPGVSSFDDLQLTERAASGRVLQITLADGEDAHPMDAPVFRRAIGTGTLRSTFFETETDDEEIVFHGRGFGHGVGMCQWGAHGMVEGGADHQSVLAHYYRGTRVHRLYD